MNDVHRVRVRSRHAAILQLAAEELRRTDIERGSTAGSDVARTLEKLAADLLVERATLRAA